MGTHEKLDIWKLSIDFVTRIYKTTQSFPSEEKFGLTNQMRRAAVSTPSNIAEGAARQSDRQNIQFLYISLGSVSELETQLIISQNLEYCDAKEIILELKTIKSKLINYIKYLKSIK